MSLWEKWEREKLEAQGVKIKRPKDVIVRDAPVKKSPREQAMIIGIWVVFCLVVVYAALTTEAVYSGRRWSETYIVRLFVERAAAREEESR
jgi:type II secretory pathway component PulM